MKNKSCIKKWGITGNICPHFCCITKIVINGIEKLCSTDGCSMQSFNDCYNWNKCKSCKFYNNGKGQYFPNKKYIIKENQ